jgi:pSer/pThr/pTyr-binding forkhead associated (FHA) protein
MAKRRLVINSEDAGQFVLLIEGDMLTIGGSRPDAATVLQQLRVVHVHCVLDVEGDHITLRNDEPDAPGTPQEMPPGRVLPAGTSQVCLQAEAASSGEPGLLPVDAEPPPAAATPAGPQGRREKRFLVVDGGDQGQAISLPESGTLTLGKDRKHADIVLHDFYIAKAHCRLKIFGDKVEVVDDDNHGTQVNGKNIRRHEMVAGDVLRIGNSHLRLEMSEPGEKFAKAEKSAAAEDDEPIELTVVEEEDDAESPEAEAEPLPAHASEPVRLLHVWRDKLTQFSGQTFGHYKLGAVLGRGRCGVVFCAEDTKTGQTVALKVFSPQFPQGNPELQRFAAVMKTILPLRHPHLVSLFGAGKTSTYTWVAREFVEGVSLAQVIQRQAEKGQFDEARACRVLLHVGRALDFARQQKLRHGKVTPANILIQRSNRATKLADLMLGSVLEGSQLGRAVLEHRPITELGYLAPEQADPQAFVDELSDIYGLGAVVFALLTGRPPFVGDSVEEILEQLRGAARVPRPSSLNAEVSAPLEKVVLKMTARRQEDRYPTPAALLADVEPIAGELGIEG